MENTAQANPTAANTARTKLFVSSIKRKKKIVKPAQLANKA